MPLGSSLSYRSALHIPSKNCRSDRDYRAYCQSLAQGQVSLVRYIVPLHSKPPFTESPPCGMHCQPSANHTHCYSTKHCPTPQASPARPAATALMESASISRQVLPLWTSALKDLRGWLKDNFVRSYMHLFPACPLQQPQSRARKAWFAIQ
jgi:hypothetical protein